MKTATTPQNLTDQVYDTIVEEVCTGAIVPGEHLVQEQLAERFGVSRQTIMQAMARLKADGLCEQIGRRGLQVSVLDLDKVQYHYDIRAALDGLGAKGAARQAKASRETAETLARLGGELLKEGERARMRGDIAEQVRLDMELHALIYDHSGNPLLAGTAEPHWRFLRRAMSEVLRHGDLPLEVWQQHREILDAIIAGDAASAELYMVAHDLDAATALSKALSSPMDQGLPAD
ncbi:GntR family transcriptional regulator [Ponticoccus sp. SC2-23]|uniref:GntR family transcriptional regulator n=1 Tax=Alexandriicola marinus TaxID=2081710 RepID=UPI0013DF8A7C|nr:GntR family transcriptional regulator [Alexandriicola marinus]MBM1221344.1 GntR family transcriptional regulator [Ponticoccus sp. SC6-9]MBM1226385.1 GntR family transcriptional regulator [Ponticoccus sp. SC6-15]MBM1230336.1 GntR family transcriptional regulator [Ponticoccus sp. SC6-38]MBM1234859.1 GntR family transcriptional regulator [Ponticoccus sp. SC6-45]MBM1239357.1 GntR family transcriptional regulator [Ponticoccus sp. SC6-49]MBM1243139.1 GntR family transcriptional regulator [Pontic